MENYIVARNPLGVYVIFPNKEKMKETLIENNYKDVKGGYSSEKATQFCDKNNSLTRILFSHLFNLNA